MSYCRFEHRKSIDLSIYPISKLIQNKAAIRGSVADVQKALSSGANINNYAILVKFNHTEHHNNIISIIKELYVIKLSQQFCHT